MTSFLPPPLLPPPLPRRKPRRTRMGAGKPPAILTIDTGTSATKSALFFPDTHKLTRPHRHAHQTHAGPRHHATQNPTSWLKAALETARKTLSTCHAHILAISLTGHMQDLIAVGDSPPPILSDTALLYSDARAQSEAAIIFARTHRQMSATSLPAKLLLLQPPTPSSNYSLLLGATDYLCHALSTHPKPLVTDPTTVSTTSLTLFPHRQYDKSLFQTANLTPYLPSLPAILPAPAPVGTLCPSVAALLNRPDLAHIPIIHAAGDLYTATIGSLSQFHIYAGTTGWIAKTSPINQNPAPHPSLFRLAHARLPSHHILAASVADVGIAITHACNTILHCPPSQLDALASSVPVGAAGLVYLPYLTSRRCPRARDVVAPALYALRPDCTRAHVARAVLEGVVFSMAEAATLLERPASGPIPLVGGVSACGVFVRGLAALLGDVLVSEPDVGLLGAGIEAARVLGVELSHIDPLRDGRVVTVPAAEKESWFDAWMRWRKVLERVEPLWHDDEMASKVA